LLNAVDEPARTFVRLVRFEGLTPAQVADQCGRPLKDIKLAIRNAYQQMCSELEADAVSLFADIAFEDCSHDCERINRTPTAGYSRD
jgi:hypothetical protein